MQIVSPKTSTIVVGGHTPTTTQSRSKSQAANSSHRRDASTPQSEHDRLVSTIKMFFGFL